MPLRQSRRLYHQLGRPGPGTKVAGYVRYSSDMQSATSITTQKRAILSYCEQCGWEVVEWFEEPEQSAKYEEIEDRPIFAQMLREAGSPFQAVLCYTTNRWARNVGVAEKSLNQLRRKGVWWATVNEEWDIDKVQQQGHALAFGLTLHLDQDFSIQLSKRTIAGKEDRAVEGYHNGQPTFGYVAPDYPNRPPGAPANWKAPRMPQGADPEKFPALVRLGELVAAGWSDAAIADALAGYLTNSPRFGERPLSKDTIAAIRRSWFPREFAPGCGYGTIETPSGEKVEGKHPAAWSYELWHRMVEAKTAQFHRPIKEAKHQAHAFSRIIVCASCRRQLRVQPYLSGHIYYRDTSAIRKLPCSAGGQLMVNARQVTQQFGELLASLQLPPSWRDAIAERAGAGNRAQVEAERLHSRRATLEGERDRLVTAYTKGYLSEEALDAKMSPLLAELQQLPLERPACAVEATVAAAVSAGETLADIASYWSEATREEQRDMVWALLPAEGLIYDLERRLIAGIRPRPDFLPVLTLGLCEEWETSEGGLWRIGVSAQPLAPQLQRRPPQTPPALSPEQQDEALALVQAGQSLRRVAGHFGVSHGAIWRLLHGRQVQELSRYELKQRGDVSVD